MTQRGKISWTTCLPSCRREVGTPCQRCVGLPPCSSVTVWWCLLLLSCVHWWLSWYRTGLQKGLTNSDRVLKIFVHSILRHALLGMVSVVQSARRNVVVFSSVFLFVVVIVVIFHCSFFPVYFSSFLPSIFLSLLSFSFSFFHFCLSLSLSVFLYCLSLFLPSFFPSFSSGLSKAALIWHVNECLVTTSLSVKNKTSNWYNKDTEKYSSF